MAKGVTVEKSEAYPGTAFDLDRGAYNGPEQESSSGLCFTMSDSLDTPMDLSDSKTFLIDKVSIPSTVDTVRKIDLLQKLPKEAVIQ